MSRERLLALLVLCAQGCDWVTIDVETIRIRLESQQLAHPQTGQALPGCADADLGVKNLGAVWIGLRRHQGQFSWFCETLGPPDSPETLPQLEAELDGVGFEPVGQGRWDVWVLGYASDGGGCPPSPQNTSFARLCGVSAALDIPTETRALNVPVTCVPFLSVTAEHKVIEAEVERCFSQLFPSP